MGDGGFLGGDTEAMTELAGALGRGGQVLDALADAAQAIRERIEGGCWTGPDAESFGGTLTGWIGAARASAGTLRGHGEDLSAHARDQDATSAGDSGGSGGGAAAGGSRSARAGSPGSGAGPAGVPQVLRMDPEVQARAAAWLERHVPGVGDLPEPVPREEGLSPRERLARSVQH